MPRKVNFKLIWLLFFSVFLPFLWLGWLSCSTKFPKTCEFLEYYIQEINAKDYLMALIFPVLICFRLVYIMPFLIPSYLFFRGYSSNNHRFYLTATIFSIVAWFFYVLIVFFLFSRYSFPYYQQILEEGSYARYFFTDSLIFVSVCIGFVIITYFIGNKGYEPAFISLTTWFIATVIILVTVVSYEKSRSLAAMKYIGIWNYENCYVVNIGQFLLQWSFFSLPTMIKIFKLSNKRTQIK